MQITTPLKKLSLAQGRGSWETRGAQPAVGRNTLNSSEVPGRGCCESGLTAAGSYTPGSLLGGK